MKSILRIALGLLGSLVLLIVLALIGARFADGPVAIIAGGPFTSDKLYERGLVRIEEGPLLAPLTAELSWKYARVADIGPEAVTSGYLWLFEFAPRS